MADISRMALQSAVDGDRHAAGADIPKTVFKRFCR
jgi:hypothetical protein